MLAASGLKQRSKAAAEVSFSHKALLQLTTAKKAGGRNHEETMETVKDTARGPSRKKHVRLLQGHQDKPPSMYMNFHVRLLRLHVPSFLLLSPKRIQNTAQKLQMKGNEGPAQKRAFKTGNINFKGRVFRLNRLLKITLFIRAGVKPQPTPFESNKGLSAVRLLAPSCPFIC